ncbi:MAG TPA: polyprenyl diphosphate synthase [Candidatus Chromulinivoraceae bacterium]|nr:polyprenyl diphosphate synthase [Candidatus Chromulinivoraceae bacterium]
MAEEAIVPQHIGFIVDGNRRWAKKHGIPTYEGHLAGYNTSIDVMKATFEAGVKVVSMYAFSTENWKRSESEVSKIMSLVLRLLTSDIHILQENGIRLKMIGSREGLSKGIAKAIDEAEAKTASNTRGTLAVCFNYGGQLEIVDACKKIVEAGVSADKITPELIIENLYAPGLPPVDLVVRTSGEQRLSNFMLWRAAYSEFIFLEKFWPDMTKDDVTAILEEYSRRGRRFGG